MKEEVLSLDLEDNDFLYRIQKDSRIVYVSVLHEDIIPPDCRTESFRVLSNLRDIPGWNEDWNTLTIRKDSQGIKSSPDEFTPHSLDIRLLDFQHDHRYYNILDLTPLSRISDRVSRVLLAGGTCILKIARFKHEVPALQREVSVYTTLISRGFPFAPTFLGYAYEEVRDRTIGFLMEDIPGRMPDIQDLEDCRSTVSLLHKCGIIHGDVNKYNFLIGDNGAKIFDFEVSTIQEKVESVEAEEEMRTLAERLQDDSGIGKR